MTRNDRMKEIEVFWKSKTRKTNWSDIKWEPYISQEYLATVPTPHDAYMYLKFEGVVIWTISLAEAEVYSDFDWEEAFLHFLYIWYWMPENWDAPLFVNEEANVVCIPMFNTRRFALLFQHPESVMLGMRHWESRHRKVESKCTGTTPAQVNLMEMLGAKAAPTKFKPVTTLK